jgi:Spy/CpxP family protein refolding chaperone
MNQWIIRSMCVAALAAASVGVSAQPAGTPPAPPTPAQQAAHQVSRLAQLLDLNASQQNIATAAFTAESTTMQGLHGAFQTAQSNLKTAIQNNDAAGIAAAAKEIGALTQQQIVAHSMAEAALYATLSAEQQTKLQALRTMGGPGGPGGPGGHGGGPGGPGGPPQL